WKLRRVLFRSVDLHFAAAELVLYQPVEQLALLVALLLAPGLLGLLRGGRGRRLALRGGLGGDAAWGAELVGNLARLAALRRPLPVVRDAALVHPFEYLAERRRDRGREDQKVQ